MAVGFGQIDSSSYQSVNKPSEILWSETGFIVGVGDQGIRLNLVHTRLETVELFGQTFKSGDEVHIAIAPGGNMARGNVYGNRDDTIFEISKDGATVRNFAVPSPGVNIADLTFDIDKYWNWRLIATTYDGSVWAIDKTGSVEHIANLGSGAVPSGLLVAPADFGSVSGNILVTLANENKIMSISNVDHGVTVFHEFMGETVGMMAHNIVRSTLYVSNHDGDNIVKIDQENTKPYWTQVMLITENEMDGSKSINFIRSTALGVEISKLASGIMNPDFAGAVFVSDSDFENSLLVPEEEIPDMDTNIIVYPVLVIAMIGIVIVIWRYRGF
mgnify:CR=1 FL=1